MHLEVLNLSLSICRLSPDSPIPEWVFKSRAFLNVTRTNEELSIVLDSEQCPSTIKQESGWKAIKVRGPLDFSLTGILSNLIQPLAEAKISIFAISTFDTDYLLIKEESLEQAIKILEADGHLFNNK